MSFPILCAIVLTIAVIMTMTGRGGGNFYVIVLVLAGQAMHQAATLGQFILMITAFAGMIIFQKNKMIDWKLALVMDPPTDIMAFVGGYFSDSVTDSSLKIAFSFLLLIAGVLMFLDFKEKPIEKTKKFGYWERTYNGKTYVVNLWLTIPFTALVGLASGALGISGGSFKIPLMVLLCGVPMKIAVGTSSAMVGATALMGFAGHYSRGHFNSELAIPLALTALVGGLIGGKFAMKTKSKNLKYIFALTTIGAAIAMGINGLVNLR